MRKRLIWPLALTGAIGIVGGVAWMYRTPLVTGYVDRTLKSQGVDARYTIEQVGFRTQRLRNVSIGDPKAPDLTAREITVDITLGIDGPHITNVQARGVRLRGRWTGDRLTLGQLDKLLPAPSDDPFEWPDMAVDLADAAATIDTPWGVTHLGAVGQGHLRNGFSGHVAVRADKLAAAGCEVTGVTGNVRLNITARSPNISGPLGFGALACPGQKLRLGEMRLGLRGTASEDLSRWQVESGVRGGTLSYDRVRGGGVTGEIKARSGTAGAIAAEWQLAGRDAASPWFDARRLSLIGTGGRAGDGTINASGTVGIDGGRAGRDTMQQFAALTRWDNATPVGPLMAKAGRALVQAGRDVSLLGRYDLHHRTDRGLSLTLGDVSARSASGMQMALAGERALGWDPTNGLSLQTRAAISGGGLPEGSISLSRAGAGRALTGEARFAPYVAGDAALAVAPLRFVAAADGTARFSTGVALSGPLAGGRIDRLAMPIVGQVGRDGTVAISGECRALAWRNLTVGSVALDPATIRLCGQGNAPLLAIGPRGLSGGATIARLALTGRAGSNPLRLASQGGSLRLSDGAFELNGVDAAVGAGDSATRFSAARIAGAQGQGGLAGVMTGAQGKVGPVPFLLSDANGRWTFADGRLSLNAAMRVTDMATDARFHPLLTDDVVLTLVDGRIDVTGQLKEETSGAAVANLTIGHDLSRGAGQARFSLADLHFTPDGLQPATLSNLALGVIANADGVVSGTGQLDWDATGVRSSGDFSTDRLDFAAAFGPVQRLSGRLHFDDLIALSSPPHQRVALGSVNPGIEVTEGELLYQMLPGQQVRIEGGHWPFAGGELRMQPALLDFGADVPRRMTFDVANIDAGLFLQRYQFENISATGIFDGVLPTVFDQNGGRVEGGVLVSRSGGTLAYVGELSTRDLGPYANLAFGALKSLKYDDLVIRMNGNIDGEMLTEVDFAGLGQGVGVTDNFITRSLRRLPFTFSIRINAPFRQLLTSARGLYDPTVLIEQNLPALIRADREAAERAAAARAVVPGAPILPPAPAPTPPTPPTGDVRVPTVQPRESEDRP